MLNPSNLAEHAFVTNEASISGANSLKIEATSPNGSGPMDVLLFAIFLEQTSSPSKRLFPLDILVITTFRSAYCCWAGPRHLGIQLLLEF